VYDFENGTRIAAFQGLSLVRKIVDIRARGDLSIEVREAFGASSVELIKIETFVDRPRPAHGVVRRAFWESLHGSLVASFAVPVGVASIERPIVMKH